MVSSAIPQLLQLGQQLADHPVKLLHPVGVPAQPGLVPPPVRQARPDVHAGGVVPQQERPAGLVGTVDEVKRAGQQVVLDSLHPLAGQRPRIGDGLAADPAEAFVLGRVVGLAGPAVQHPPRGKQPLHDRVVPGVVGLLGLLLGVEVVQVAVELIKAVHGGEVLVAVAQVVLAVLGGHVALGLEQLGQGRVLGLDALLGAGHPHRGQPGPHRQLPGDERRPPGGTARLGVGVGEQHAL
jgi:hypothetical protein